MRRNGQAGDTGINLDRVLAGIPRRSILAQSWATWRRLSPAVSGQAGHDGTYWPARVACLGFDLGRDAGFAVLKKHFNPRCEPPWPDADLLHKCADADTLPFDKPRGWWKDAEADGIHETDLGNARRVIARHGDDLRFVHPWKSWLVWDGRRWARDATAETVRRVKETQGAMFRDAIKRINELANAGSDEARAERDTAKRLVAHALKWEDARAIARCIELAKSEAGVPMLPDDMDRDHWLLNVENGTLDLRTGTLRPHRRLDLITKLAPVTYDQTASCPRWLSVLDRIMGGNRDLITYLQRVCGYCLTGDVSEQCLWFFHGAGANGKSTFLGALLAMLGDYGMQAVSDLLMVKHNEAHPTERADLFGKRFVATIETEEGKRLAESLMKQLTGGDRMRRRGMRRISRVQPGGGRSSSPPTTSRSSAAPTTPTGGASSWCRSR